MLDFGNDPDFEQELEALLGAQDEMHPIHRVVYQGGALVTATGSTSNACVICSPSSGTRCGGGFTQCG
ncbi:hypothetical protein [Tropicibacter oceani]|uniref:Uncharacterized protein n=1 Tax=Tropicibacter oceani TaxID=3058420 RepID=A0ABY8QGG9_9RHOB|nr:hypothetical protein [Tropicibacter oceani]WGW03625.1 hypothetical protein QF118_17160 [Tropicibacter oceani]